MASRGEVNHERRRLLRGAGAVLGAAALPGGIVAPASARQATGAPVAGNVTARVARYMVEARDRPLPAAVAREAKHRILDTLAAMISGAALAPGVAAIRYVQ